MHLTKKVIYLSILYCIAISNPFYTELKASSIKTDINKKNDSFHSVMAAKGDGVFSLLRRYGLIDNSSNVQQFYKLNNLKKDGKLMAGKVYILPVLIFAYNGNSIRSSIGDDDWDKAVRIQHYNEFLHKNKLRKRSYRSSKILWVPYHEISKSKSAKILKKTKEKDTQTSGKITTGKEKSKTTEKGVNTTNNDVYEPLFGKKHGKFKREDNSLKKQVFYIVSGHGGPDPGAQCLNCKSTLCEDEYAYDVALRLVRNLKQHGAIVHMIIQDKNDGIRDELYLDCDYDETCMGKKIPRNQTLRLKQRAHAINKLSVKYNKQGITNQKAIMIHVDSNNEKKRQDTYFYYYKKSKSGKALAYNIQSTFKEKYNKFQKGRGYKGSVRERGLFMLKNTNPTAVYVELANIRNQYNHERLLRETNRQALANWLFEGLIK